MAMMFRNLARSSLSQVRQAWNPMMRQTNLRLMSSFSSHDPSIVRNIAVIAHVDHGKTTLVDQLIRAGGDLDQEERVLDSGSLEKERGITIMSKTTRVDWENKIFNLVDTPGHSDFGGEVERVLSMVDGAILVVDASEGVMSQTKFVVSKALAQGLKIVVVLNKADRDTARLNGEVETEIFDLLCSMDASDEQLDFPIIYASAKQGWAVDDMSNDKETAGMKVLLQAISDHVKPPCDIEKTKEPFQFSVNNIGFDTFIGKLLTGKITSGTVKVGQKVHVLRRSPDEHLPEGSSGSGTAAAAPSAQMPITHIFCIRNGKDRVPVESAQAGDIVMLAGIPNELVGVSDTISDPSVTKPLPTVPVTPPTISMSFGANDSPLAGRSGGTFLNSNQVKNRLTKEVENNVTLLLKQSATDSDQMEVHARGELQLGILIEEMRREGYELCVSPPRILTIKCKETGKELEPVEEVTIDVDQEYSGTVIERMQMLRAPMEEYKEMGNRVRLIFQLPSRLLMGVRSVLRNDTHGSAVVNSMFTGYEKFDLSGSGTESGRLVSMDNGSATAYALNLLEQRGVLFIEPGQEVYEGMVIGENSRPGDMEVNPTKGKKLTNVRSVLADEKVILQPPRRMSLEEHITYMNDDEVLEITPNAIRLRKRFLNASDRLRAQKNMKLKKLNAK